MMGREDHSWGPIPGAVTRPRRCREERTKTEAPRDPGFSHGSASSLPASGKPWELSSSLMHVLLHSDRQALSPHAASMCAGPGCRQREAGGPAAGPVGAGAPGVWVSVVLVERTGNLSSAHFQEPQDCPPPLASAPPGPDPPSACPLQAPQSELRPWTGLSASSKLKVRRRGAGTTGRAWSGSRGAGHSGLS